MTLWKPQNRSGDLLGPNCLRGPLFSFAVKPLYIGHALRHGPPELYSYTALHSAIHYTAIHRLTLYNLYNTPLQQVVLQNCLLRDPAPPFRLRDREGDNQVTKSWSRNASADREAKFAVWSMRQAMEEDKEGNAGPY